MVKSLKKPAPVQAAPPAPKSGVTLKLFTAEDTPQRELSAMMARLVALAQEVAAPLPTGLTPGAQRAVQEYRDEMQQEMHEFSRLIEGFAVGCGRSGTLSPEEVRQAEMMVTALLTSPETVLTMAMKAPDSDAKPKSEEGSSDAAVAPSDPSAESPVSGGAG